jgi:phosphatidylcholine synthase
MFAPRQAAAWGVHLYTASGALFGMLALMAVSEGAVRHAFLYLVAAAIVDATDGLLARLVRVNEVLPSFSGAQVDNAVDVLTFIWVPIFLMGAENLLPSRVWLAVPILAALYAYGQVNMKTPDNCFLGFPSYWNIVALYLYWLRPGPLAAVLMVVIPGIMSFIPTRYLYPSRNRAYWKTSWTLAMVWVVLLVVLLLEEEPNRTLVWLSLFYPIYYTLLSFYLDWKIRRAN